MWTSYITTISFEYISFEFKQFFLNFDNLSVCHAFTSKPLHRFQWNFARRYFDSWGRTYASTCHRPFRQPSRSWQSACLRACKRGHLPSQALYNQPHLQVVHPAKQWTRSWRPTRGEITALLRESIHSDPYNWQQRHQINDSRQCGHQPACQAWWLW